MADTIRVGAESEVPRLEKKFTVHQTQQSPPCELAEQGELILIAITAFNAGLQRSQLLHQYPHHSYDLRYRAS